MIGIAFWINFHLLIHVQYILYVVIFLVLHKLNVPPITVSPSRCNGEPVGPKWCKTWEGLLSTMMPIGSMELAYLPTWMVDFYGKW